MLSSINCKTTEGWESGERARWEQHCPLETEFYKKEQENTEEDSKTPQGEKSALMEEQIHFSVVTSEQGNILNCNSNWHGFTSLPPSCAGSHCPQDRYLKAKLKILTRELIFWLLSFKNQGLDLKTKWVFPSPFPHSSTSSPFTNSAKITILSWYSQLKEIKIYDDSMQLVIPNWILDYKEKEIYKGHCWGDWKCLDTDVY